MTTELPTVVEATIERASSLMDMRFLNGSARAVLIMSDNKTQTFQWFHDEISYSPSDFIGKTMDEIREMHKQHDQEYLRS